VSDEKTGVSSKVVMDSRGTGSKNAPELRPTVVVLDKKGKPVQLPAGGEARYAISPDAILSVEDGSTVHAGDVLARIPTEGAKTRDITGGLPRVAELFEARKPKDNAIIAKISGRVQFLKDYKAKRKIAIVPEDGGDPVERHAERVVQHEGEPFGGAERVQDHEQGDAHGVGEHRLLLGVGIAGGRRFVERDLAAGRAGAQHVQADPGDDGGEPRPLIADVVAVGPSEPQPGLLHRVVGLARRTEHAVRDRVQVRPVLLEVVHGYLPPC